MGKRHHQRQPGKQQFPYRWLPASLTFNIYFYLFLYLYTTRRGRINNNIPHLKLLKNQNRRAVFDGRHYTYLGASTSLRRTSLSIHTCEFLFRNIRHPQLGGGGGGTLSIFHFLYPRPYVAGPFWTPWPPSEQTY